MNRLFAAPVLALGLGFAAMPASAVVYCKTVGVPKGCVARPAAAVAAPGVGAPGVGGRSRRSCRAGRKCNQPEWGSEPLGRSALNSGSRGSLAWSAA